MLYVWVRITVRDNVILTLAYISGNAMSPTETTGNALLPVETWFVLR